jgi:hypothetical protein
VLGAAGSFGQDWREPSDPPVDADVVDLHATLSQQLFNIAIGESVTEVPAHCKHDHLPGKPEAGDRRSWRADRMNTADAAHALEHADDVLPLCNSPP